MTLATTESAAVADAAAPYDYCEVPRGMATHSSVKGVQGELLSY